MKKLCLTLLTACLFAPALSMAQPAPAATPAVSAPAATTPAATPPAAATKAKKPSKVKGCNPAKSKKCGNACIPLARTCHK